MLMDTKVLLADDHAVLREGLRMVLESEPGITIVGEAGDGRQAVQMVEEFHPDVVVMDISMPHLNGLDATQQIHCRHPDARVVILTMHDSREYLRQIVRCGAIGCVLKQAAARELVIAVQAAAHNESFFSQAIAGKILDDYRIWLDQGAAEVGEPLTEREREVLQLVAEGRNNRDIAWELGVSIKTVQTHRAHLMHKLNVHDRTDLVRYALGKGIVA